MTHKPNAFLRVFGLCLMVACLSFTAACGDSTDDGESGSTTGGETTGGTGTSATTGGDTTGGTTGGDTTGGTTGSTTGGDTTGGTTGGDPFEECRNTCTTLVGECEAEFLAADCTEDDLGTLETNCLAACEDEANHGQIAAAGSIACADVVDLAISTLGGEGVCEAEDLCAEVTCEEGETCNPETGECEGEADLCAEVTCEEGEICNPETGECEAEDLCAEVTCEEGETCNPETGECEAEDLCADVVCDEGETCNPETGACEGEVDLCADVVCDEGETCNPETGACEGGSSCEADAYEENNSFDTATLIEGEVEWDASLCADDVDFYTLAVPAGQDALVRIDFVDDDGDLDLASYTEDQTEFESSTGVTDSEGVILPGGEEGATYFFNVFGFRGAENPYSLSVSFAESGTGCATVNDCEDLQLCEDNSCVDVGCINDFDCEDLQVCDDTNTCIDVDCRTNFDCGDLQLCEDNSCVDVGCINNDDCGELQLCDDTNTCIDVGCVTTDDCDDLQVCDDTNTCIDVDCVTDNDCEDTEECNAENTCETIVCVSNSDCRVVAPICDAETSTCGGCDNPDAFEPNNSIDEATTFADVGDATLNVCGGPDYFVIPAGAVSRITVDITFEHAGGDVDAMIFDPADGDAFMDTSLPRLASGASSSDNEQLVVDNGVARDLILVVYGFTTASGPATNEYTVSISTEEFGCFTDDNCGDLQICQDNACVDVECVDDDDCTGDDYCRDDNTCGGCQSDDQCAEGELCNTNTGACGVCFDDEFEANDTSEEAAALPVETASYDLSMCAGDRDYLSFTLTTGQSALIGLLFSDDSGDIDVRLRDAAGDIIVSSASSTDNEFIAVPTVTEDTDFVLEIFGFNNQTNFYTLEFTLDPEGILCNSNNDCEDPLVCNDGLCGDPPPCEGDNDCGFGEVCNLETGECEVPPCASDDDCGFGDVCNLENGECVDCLSNDDCGGDTICTSTNTCAQCELDTDCTDGDICSEGGCVECVTDDDCTDGTCVESVCLPDTCGDDFDTSPDAESIDNAAPITAGEYPGLQLCFDEDWYSIDLEAGDIVGIDISFIDAEGDIDLYLRDGANTNVASSTGVTDTESVFVQIAEAGTYYIFIRNFSSAFTSYDMNIVVNPDGACFGDDECADGEGCVNNTCAPVDCTTDADCADTEECTAERTCAVIVCDSDSDCRGSAPLCDTETNACVACTDDAFESNDDADNASVLGDVGDATLNICGSSDYFGFSVEDGAVVTINVFFSDAEGDIDAYVFDTAIGDAFADRLDSSTSSSDNETLTFTASETVAGEGVSAMLVVFGFNGAANDYTLDVDIVPPGN